MSKKTSSPLANSGMKKLYAFDKVPGEIDLSLSENPLGCSSLVTSSLNNIDFKISHYPSNKELQLKEKLAQFFELNAGNFFISNGSSPLITAICQNLTPANTEVVLPALTFPMFKISAQVAELKTRTAKMNLDLSINLNNLINEIGKDTRLVVICNPNNPTGNVLTKQAIVSFLKDVSSNILVVVDEANIEFGGESVVDLIPEFKNLIVLRTFSKGFGLANLRVGFMVANPGIIMKLEESLPPFCTSELNLELATVSLDDKQFLADTKSFVTKERKLLVEQLTKIGLKIFSTQANNVFCQIPKTSPKNFRDLLEAKSVSVIWGSNFDGFDDTFFRISIRDQQTNQKFITIVKSILERNNVK